MTFIFGYLAYYSILMFFAFGLLFLNNDWPPGAWYYSLSRKNRTLLAFFFGPLAGLAVWYFLFCKSRK